jgi:flagellar hook assembly protein FlgD
LGGRLVRTQEDEDVPRGSHRVVWDGTGLRGKAVGSGSYVARLEAVGEAASLPISFVR